MDYTALALTLAVFGVLMIAISYQRHRHARDASAILHGTAGVILVISGALLFELALNLNTYQDAQEAVPLADITFNAGKDKNVEVTLVRIPGGDLQVFNLNGSQWQLKAESLHWRRFLPWFGFTPQIRLSELLSHDTLGAGAQTTPARYALRHDGGISLWRWGQTQTGDTAWVQTESLVSSPLPLEGQRVQVYLQGNTLLIRPIQKRIDNTRSKPPLTPVLNDHARSLLRNSELTVGGTAEEASPVNQPN